MKRFSLLIIILHALILIWGGFNDVAAEAIPSSADVSRVRLDALPRKGDHGARMQSFADEAPSNALPKSVSSMQFTLDSLDVQGASRFTQDEIRSLYSQYLGQRISLGVAWAIADRITALYRNAGYFLSRAYVPAQEIEGGKLTLKVVEGYIGQVEFETGAQNQSMPFSMLKDELTSNRPLNSRELETFMLRLNEIAKDSYQGILHPMGNGPEGAVKLVLSRTKDNAEGYIAFDNYGSKFLGPYQSIASYTDSFFRGHATTLSASTSVPISEMNYVELSHKAFLTPSWAAVASGSYARSRPGGDLEDSDISSSTRKAALGIIWNPLLHREENLSMSLTANAINARGDMLGNTPLTRDRIRTLEAALNYEKPDSLRGRNIVRFEAVRGLNVLGASKKNQANLSRAEAKPHFTTASAQYQRYQIFPMDLALIGKIAGQMSSSALYSSHEFGYGGQIFGRAYDPSEITGDEGLAGSLEARYNGLPLFMDTQVVPYAFYDIGKVWNLDANNTSTSASSAGAGILLKHETGLGAHAGVAWPLTKEVNEPLYGNGKNPRYVFQVSYIF